MEALGTDWARSPSLDSSAIHAWVPAPGEGKGEGAHGNRSSTQDLQSARDPGHQPGLRSVLGSLCDLRRRMEGTGWKEGSGRLPEASAPAKILDGWHCGCWAGLSQGGGHGRTQVGAAGHASSSVSSEHSTNALQAFLAEGSDQVSVWGPLGCSGEQGSHEWAWGLLPGPDQSGVLWGSVCLPLSPPAVNAAQLPFPEPGGSRRYPSLVPHPRRLEGQGSAPWGTGNCAVFLLTQSPEPSLFRFPTQTGWWACARVGCSSRLWDLGQGT